MIKKIICICLCVLLTACGNTIKYERSTEPGIIQEITMDDVQRKIENKETFMFVFTQITCHNCADFKEYVLTDYIQNHGFEFNEVVLSIFIDTKPVFEWVKQHPNPIDQLEEGLTPEDVLTPTFYFVEKGEVKDIFIGSKMTRKVLDEMVVKYRLDEVK